MQVILLKKVQNLGELGDIVNVKPGYARNYLIPKGHASMATESNIQSFEDRKAELIAKEKDTLAAANARAESISGLEITITSNASPEGKLYGSIGPREIAEKLTASGFPVDKSEVIMPDGPIRESSQVEIELSLHADVKTKFNLNVEGVET